MVSKSRERGNGGRGCALGCFGPCEPLGKVPPTFYWALPVVGGARSAHDERLVTRFPRAVWPFHPSIFDAPPRSHFDQQRPALALPLLAGFGPSSACASAHSLVGMA